MEPIPKIERHHIVTEVPPIYSKGFFEKPLVNISSYVGGYGQSSRPIVQDVVRRFLSRHFGRLPHFDQRTFDLKKGSESRVHASFAIPNNGKLRGVNVRPIWNAQAQVRTAFIVVS